MTTHFTITQPQERHTLVGDPEATAWAVADFEEHIWLRYPNELDMPLAFVLMIQPDGQLLVLNMPFRIEHVRASVPASVPPRGRMGLFFGSVAKQMLSLSPGKLAEGTGLSYRPGQQVWFAGIAADSIKVLGPLAGHEVVSDFAQDVPHERQVHLRSLYAADGLGNAYDISRPGTGMGPVELRQCTFTPDVEKIATFTQASQEAVLGAIPWAAAVMAMAHRAAFPYEPAVVP